MRRENISEGKLAYFKNLQNVSPMKFPALTLPWALSISGRKFGRHRSSRHSDRRCFRRNGIWNLERFVETFSSKSIARIRFAFSSTGFTKLRKRTSAQTSRQQFAFLPPCPFHPPVGMTTPLRVNMDRKADEMIGERLVAFPFPGHNHNNISAHSREHFRVGRPSLPKFSGFGQ
jgi:hypothetical protein